MTDFFENKGSYMSKQVETEGSKKAEAATSEVRERMLARVRAAITELEASTGDEYIGICQRFLADIADFHPDPAMSGQLKHAADLLMDHFKKTQTH